MPARLQGLGALHGCAACLAPCIWCLQYTVTTIGAALCSELPSCRLHWQSVRLLSHAMCDAANWHYPRCHWLHAHAVLPRSGGQSEGGSHPNHLPVSVEPRIPPLLAAACMILHITEVNNSNSDLQIKRMMHHAHQQGHPSHLHLLCCFGKGRIWIARPLLRPLDEFMVHVITTHTESNIPACSH